MEIIEHGRMYDYPYGPMYFRCKRCGCKFIATHEERIIEHKHLHVFDIDVTYVYCKCPECGEIVSFDGAKEGRLNAN